MGNFQTALMPQFASAKCTYIVSSHFWHSGTFILQKVYHLLYYYISMLSPCDLFYSLPSSDMRRIVYFLFANVRRRWGSIQTDFLYFVSFCELSTNLLCNREASPFAYFLLKILPNFNRRERLCLVKRVSHFHRLKVFLAPICLVCKI